MSNTMKAIVFIISLIAYFIYLVISSTFVTAALDSSNLTYAVMTLYSYYAIGILIVLYTQAAVKFWFVGRNLKDAHVYLKLPTEKFRLNDRLVVYFLPALAVFLPLVQTRSLTAINWQSILFFILLVIAIEILFLINRKTMKTYITNKGIFIRGIDLRLELPIPFTYQNPSGHFTFDRIITFLDLNDRLMIEHCYDMGYITVIADSETLKQVKGVLIANGIKQKKF